MSYTFHQENEQWLADEGEKSAPEVAGEEITDPTAMSGTLDTSGTTGTQETAEDVSPIFDAADEQAAQNTSTEGELHRNDPGHQSEAQASVEAAGKTAEENEADAKAAAEGDADGDDKGGYDLRKNLDDYSVKEVKAYLAEATPEQKAKVKERESKGQNRAGIMNA